MLRASPLSRRNSRPSPAPRLLVVAPRRDGWAEALLAAAAGRGRWQAELPPATDAPDAGLVVGVHAVGDDAGRAAFADWTHTPSLAVARGPGVVLAGPLALPSRVGCGRCALDRMTAAAASRRRSDGRGETAAAAAAVTPVAEQVGHILSHGFAASPLLDHVMAVDLASGAATLHRVVPPPHCPVCGGASALPPDGRAPSPLPAAGAVDELLAALAGWVDPWTGVVADLLVDRHDDGDGLPVVVTAAPPHVVERDGSLRRLPLGWGKGLDLASAVRSAVGEAIERYAPSLPDPARIVRRRPDDLAGERFDPRDFPLYGDGQYARAGFPFARFDPGVGHPWVRGRWLDGGAPVWVPAVFAYLSLDLSREQNFCQGSSNGLAAAADLDAAALGAVFELIERDAFLAAWWSGAAGRRVEPDASLGDGLLRTLAAVERLGGAVELYLLPTGVCGAVAVALALGDGVCWPGVTLGLGADLDPRRALRQAILELGQTGPHLRRLMRSGALPAPGGPAAVRSMLDHAAYYFPRQRAAAFDRLRRDGGTVAASALPPPGGERSLRGCAAALRAAGVRVALVDVTSPDVASGPFRVVRAVSPDLQPIAFGHGLERLPVVRLRALAAAAEPPAVHPIW